MNKLIATLFVAAFSAAAFAKLPPLSDEAKAKAASSLDEGRRRMQITRSEPRNDGSKK